MARPAWGRDASTKHNPVAIRGSAVMRIIQVRSHLSNSTPHGKSRTLPGVTSILAAAALAPVLVTSVWLPPDNASTWIWAAIAISLVAAFAIILLFGLLIREHRALQEALNRQSALEGKIASIAQALEDAKGQFDLLDIQEMSSPAPEAEVERSPTAPPKSAKIPSDRA